jgi:hypothetical protein
LYMAWWLTSCGRRAYPENRNVVGSLMRAL